MIKSLILISLILTMSIYNLRAETASEKVNIKETSLPENVTKSLEEAGENRVELEKVISYYQAENDSLKLKATYFLIGNMSGHSFVKYSLVDTLGESVLFTPSDYPDYKTLEESFKIMEDENGLLDFEVTERYPDLENIKSDFLINQIDNAFLVWRERPWAKALNFDHFLEYVLPYRGSNEPLEKWRDFFITKYQNVATDMKDSLNPIEAAVIINDDIMKWFTFDPRYYYHPTDQSLSEMLETGYGRCEDMTNVTIYAMRANGLAVTSDYTPYWANTGNNHAWNAIVNADGEVAPFMGAESNPGNYGLANKLAKVYRKTYGEQKENLAFQEHKQEKVPRWLGRKNFKDVTAQYVDEVDLTVSIETEIPDSVDIAYLCVFNSGQWKAIHWGRINDNSVTFTDMGPNIAYLPAIYINEEIVPVGDPFILNNDKSQDILKADDQNSLSGTLNSTTKRKQVASTDGIAKTFLTSGKVYQLSYWHNNEWEEIAQQEAGEKPLSFNSLPSNALFWMIEVGSDKEERIFTIVNGEQVWW